MNVACLSTTSPTPTPAIGDGSERISSIERSMPGHSGVCTVQPASEKRSTHGCQEIFVIQSPWMRTIESGPPGVGEGTVMGCLLVLARTQRADGPRFAPR